MKQRSNCSTSSCEMSSRNGKCRRGSGAKPKPNSPSCSTEGSSRHDGQPGLAHEISDSPWREADRLDEAFDLALAFEHPIDDCIYLALAVVRQLTLVTADRRMFDLAQRRPDLGGGVPFLA